MYFPQFTPNPMIDGSGNQQAWTYPAVSNASQLVEAINQVNPAWGCSLATGPAGGINPISNTPNLSPSGPFQPQTPTVPYLRYANGATEDAYNVANIFRHGYGGSYLTLQLKYEIEGTMALWQEYLDRQNQ